VVGGEEILNCLYFEVVRTEEGEEIGGEERVREVREGGGRGKLVTRFPHQGFYHRRDFCFVFTITSHGSARDSFIIIIFFFYFNIEESNF
jgi:hypothetical protein